MSEKSENITLNQLTFFAVDSPVKILATPEEKQGFCHPQNQDCGLSSAGLLTKLDPDMLLWRTLQRCLTGEWELFLETWPKWGMMQNGEVSRLKALEHITRENEYLLLPTPTASFSGRIPPLRNHDTVASLRELFPELTGKTLDPLWFEMIMGFPTGWTDLEDSETP